MSTDDATQAAWPAIFEPLRFPHLEVKNRLFRSSISGRFDNYDGSGTQTRIDWDIKFARGGIGAVISSNTPVHPRGLIVPNYAHLDSDDKVPFWTELGKRVRDAGAKYIVQLAFSGRQRDIPSVLYDKGLSSTDKPDPMHGFPCERMTKAQIDEVVDSFAQAARRAREAGLDGIEIHGCNGYLITQFLSPAINDRTDEYGGSLENRARFPLEVVRAMRKEIGDDFHLQFKISAIDDGKALFPWGKEGTTLEESIQVCRWLVEAGVDGLHISSGYLFPHPRNPAGKFPIADVIRSYDTMLSSGRNTFRNYLMFRTPPINKGFAWVWERRARKLGVEGINLELARAVKQSVDVPVLCAGGFQTASVIARAIENGSTDGVTMGRHAHRQPRPAQPVRRGPRPGAAAVHLLQQVPDQLRREPARLLRGEPLPLARRDDPPHHVGLRGGAPPGRGQVSADAIFEPLALGPLTVRNRVLRSSVAGRLDNYDGSGTEVRVNWDLRFARGGVGAIISSNAPIHGRGSIVPGYAHIDSDETIPFWRQLGERVREAGCPYILQIVHAGRERIVPFLEWDKALSSSSKPEPLNGFPCEAMTTQEIADVVDMFAQASRRAKEAGLDGIEVAGANGMLPTQFLSSAINDRKDAYGGSLENRARFGLEVVRAIREAVGPDFCVGYKISAQEKLNELLPWLPEGNTLEESLQMCRWLEEAGVDYLHISAGGGFPHPRNPAGEFPAAQVVKTYDTILSSGRYTFRNYLTFRTPPLARVFGWWWTRPHAKRDIEGINLPDARAVKNVVSIPVVVTGGFQTASVIAGAIERGDCDGVTIARPLVANPDLVRHFEAGLDRAPKPCTYCNKCLFSFIEHPLACYEEARFDSREQMMQEALRGLRNGRRA